MCTSVEKELAVYDRTVIRKVLWELWCSKIDLIFPVRQVNTYDAYTLGDCVSNFCVRTPRMLFEISTCADAQVMTQNNTLKWHE